ncbi:hypothetical protein ACE1CD_12520 [Aerosakkonema sp. BLCC-F183]|uniref:hypothetical protein n=1 Tax=Aerosakkonema sp. BLCC-F183 TaxID=3342834 RepID=UPI0035B81F82
MSFVVFSEDFYLTNYPDVKAAVDVGIFQSGLTHFQKFWLMEGRVRVSPFYDEHFYLESHPDVKTAVQTGAFKSGLQHFIEFGETEGRRASLLFDEEFYLRKNPDVAAAVAAGTLTSGLAHYLEFGRAESRSGTNFNEFGYLQNNSDVAAAVEAGNFESALEHYIKSGQFEGRTGIFSGTNGNDTVIGFGERDEIYGVDISPGPCVIGGTPTGGQCLDFYSLGVREADVLIGGNGKDIFVLGRLQTESKIPPPVIFYRGGGNADFAAIDNFEIGKDEIVLAGGLNNYYFSMSDGNLDIILSRDSFSQSLAASDLVAVVKDVTSLSEIESSLRFTGGFVM